MNQARLTVLSGPTAVGKGTVVTRLIQLHPEIFVSISVTTRPPRPGEIDGVHYHFVSDDQFDALIADGALLEWAVVHGVQRYGTPLAPVVGTVAILGCIYLFFSLPTKTELFFLGWNALGLVVYFVYGRPRAGKATEEAIDPEALPEKPVLPAD